MTRSRVTLVTASECSSVGPEPLMRGLAAHSERSPDLVPRGSSVVSFEDEPRDEPLELAHGLVDLAGDPHDIVGAKDGPLIAWHACSLRLITFEGATCADSEHRDSRAPSIAPSAAPTPSEPSSEEPR